MAVPTPGDLYARSQGSDIDVDTLRAEVRALLHTPVSTLEEETAVLSQAHEILHEALR